MTEKQRVDIGFMFLYNNNGTPVNDRTPTDLENTSGLELLRVLNTLHQIGFADRKENQQRTLGGNGIVYDYWINSKGIQFVDKIPSGEYEGKSYSYHLHLQEGKENLEMQKLRGDVDKLTNDLIDYQSVKNRLFRTEIVAWVSVGILLLKLVLEYSGCKSL